MNTAQKNFQSNIERRLASNAGSLLSNILVRLQQSPSSVTSLGHHSILTMAAMQSGEKSSFCDKAVDRYERRFAGTEPKTAGQLVAQCLEVSNKPMRDSINEALPETLKQDVALVRRQKANEISTGMTP